MLKNSGTFHSKLIGAAVFWALMGFLALAHASGSHVATTTKQNDASNTIVSINMTPIAQTLIAGATVQYKAIANYKNGAVKDVTDSATWAVNNSGMSGTCASISTSGLLTAGYCNGWGTTMSVSLGGVTTTGYITSTYGNSPQVTVSPGATVISVGATQQYAATWQQLNNPSGAQNYTDKVTWISSNPAVATVNASGLATGLAPGKTVITATSPLYQYM